jgi:hypothetical protein
MDMTQIIAFLIVMLLTVLKAITMKPCADKLPSEYSPMFLSFWTSISLLVMLPFYYESVLLDFKDNAIYLLIALVKGIFFFEYVNIGQKLSKKTASSRIFMGAVACGIIAFINVLLFNEMLTQNQLISSVLISILGVIYYFKGHLSETGGSSHKAFITMLFLAVLLSVLDHTGLTNLHWFTYLILSIPVMFVISLFKTRKDKEVNVKFFFNKKILFLAAFVYILMEVVLTQVRVSILPVSVVNIAVLMCMPIVMLLMNIYWNESTIKKQLFFGVSAALIGLLAII